MESEDSIIAKANYWANSEAFDEHTRSEISDLIESRNTQELNDRFYRDLTFGTGGMRGIMGAGSCRMNIYNIRKATTALALYLKECHRSRTEPVRVAIAWDSRNRSYDFARHAAEVLAAHGIEVITLKEMRPVPVLSFMVRHFKCQAGICITASHNPPAYNGFKVYWETGGQLTPPHDKNIIAYYDRIQNYEGLDYLEWDKAREQGLIKDVSEETDSEYLREIRKLSLNPQGREGFRIAYSPIHGTGIYAVPAALEAFGFKDIVIPPEQKEPDGDFPTVSSPNPEDPEALVMALNLAREKNAHLVLATDPDSDRIACIVNENGQFISFDGNQLICLMTEYILSSLNAQNRIPENPLVVTTVVTSPLHQKIAEYYGVQCDVTLTGFKWICQRINDYEEGRLGVQRNFICGGEESYGFLCGSFVRDKDAVSSCALAAEMVAYYRQKGLLLSDVLESIYARHDLYRDRLYNLVLPGKKGAERFEKIMDYFRQSPPDSIGSYQVTSLTDILTDVVYKKEDGDWVKAGNTGLPSSNVLQFDLGPKVRFSVRPSGTEPKIKFYFSMAMSTGGKKGPEQTKLRKELEQDLMALEKQVLKLVDSIS